MCRKQHCRIEDIADVVRLFRVEGADVGHDTVKHEVRSNM